MSKRLPTHVPLRLFDPRRGDVGLAMEPLQADLHFTPGRTNHFSVLWIREGRGRFHTGLNNHAFDSPALLFANPYQTFFVEEDQNPLQGEVLQFHANFFCIETYHEEVGCNGVLFNNPQERPLVELDPSLAGEIQDLFGQIKEELQAGGLAHSEALQSYLKILLIKATRHKLKARPLVDPTQVSASLPPALGALTGLIEQHYREGHGPADYARMLHITPKALGRLVKNHLGKTLTELIRERTFQHAKWQLLHTRRPIKEVAAEVGFVDELYFSRLFKREAGLSPKAFRTFETAIRGGRNLSMD